MVVAFMMGSQPSGLTHNYGTNRCGLCEEDKDNAIHNLFVCRKLDHVRQQKWPKVTDAMPTAMKACVNDMTNFDKTVLILSGYGNKYVPEWNELYYETACFVHELYKYRSELYQAE